MSPFLWAAFILFLKAVHEWIHRITNSRLKDFSPLEYRRMRSFKSIYKAGFEILSGMCVSGHLCGEHFFVHCVCVCGV